MKNIFIAIFCLFLAGQTFISCSNSFLDEKNFSSYSPVALNDSLGYQASLVGLYYEMNLWYNEGSGQGWPSVWNVGTDIAYATPNQQGTEIPYYNYTLLTSTDGASSYAWNWAYTLINNANNIITSVESNATGLSQSGKNAIDAEAHFFRAYAYNQLATLYGAVPLVTSTIAAPKTDFVRAPLDSVNALIEKDLIYATTYLPNVKNVVSQGRVCQAAAQQLLATVYLRMKRPIDAEAQCLKIINSNNYSLITSRYGVKSSSPGDLYSDMFYYGNQRRSQGNTEGIWVLQQENPSTVNGGTTTNGQLRRVWGAAYYQITGLAICDSLGGRSIGRLRLNNWMLYKLYPTGDIRNSKYNIHRHFTYNNPAYPALLGKLVPYSGADTIFKICPYITKWGIFDPNDAFGTYMFKDIPIMRLGETYLLLAEAQYLQGKTTDAAASINALRTRANAPLVASSQVNIDLILDERARELVGEENRRMTLMRVGQETGTNMLAKRALRLNIDANCPHPIAGLDSTSTNKILLPIPQTEIDLNKDATLIQNVGY